MMRVVLVTGANRGIGSELSRQLALRGDAVVLTARDLANARAGRCHPARPPARADQTTGGHRPGQHRPTRRRPDRRYGRLDVLVNNAAIQYDTWQQANAADLQVVWEALEVNLLRASGHGRIVNVSSEAGSLASMDGGTRPTTSPRRSSTP